MPSPGRSRSDGAGRHRIEFKAVAADLSDSVNNLARDKAEETFAEDEATRNAKLFSREGAKRFFNRLWKGDIMREYYRAKAAEEAKQAIVARGSLYEDVQTHKKAMKALTDRALNAYNEFFQETLLQHGESVEDLRENMLEGDYEDVQKDLADIVKKYANGDIEEAEYQEEKRSVLEMIRARRNGQGEPAAKVFSEGLLYADNIDMLADHVREVIAHGTAVENIDLNIEFMVAKLKAGVHTETEYSRLDQLMEKMSESKFGNAMAKMVSASLSPTTTAAIFSAGAFALRRSSRWAFGALGLGALATGANAYLGETHRTRSERLAHLRDRAQGLALQQTEGFERREEMDTTVYDMRSATELSAGIAAFVVPDADGNIAPIDSPESWHALFQAVLEANTRLNASCIVQSDFVSYSHRDTLEQERTKLMLLIAKGKTLLKKHENFYIEGHAPGERVLDLETFNMLEEDKREEVLYGDYYEKNRIFAKMQRRRGLKAVGKAALTGLALAGVFAGLREAWAMGSDTLEGVMDKDANPTHITLLQRWFGRELPESHGGIDTFGQNGGEFHLPSGFELRADGDTYEILTPNGETLVEGLEITPEGTFTPESIALMEGRGINVDTELIEITHTGPAPMVTNIEMPDDVLGSTQEMVDGEVRDVVAGAGNTARATVEQQMDAQDWLDRDGNTIKINREVWYGNNTPSPVFDKNELMLEWGGVDASGVDADGNFVFDVSSMTEDGSIQEGFGAVNAPELIRNGELKILITVNSANVNDVIQVPVNPDGTITIDANSDVGRSLFSVGDDGEAVFHGRYVEVAHVRGIAEDGTEQLGILATHAGEGVDEMIHVQQVEVPVDVAREVLSEVGDNPADAGMPGSERLREYIADDGMPQIVERRFVDDGAGVLPQSIEALSSGTERIASTMVDVPVNYVVDTPFFVAFPGRVPMEQWKENRPKPVFFEPISRRDALGYAREFVAKELEWNPHFDVHAHEQEATADYLEAQSSDYRESLVEMTKDAPAMKQGTKAVVAIPASAGAAALRQTLEAYKGLEELDKVEFVVMATQGGTGSPAETKGVVDALKAGGMNIVYLEDPSTEATTAGMVRKRLNDAILLRKQQAGIEGSVKIFQHEVGMKNFDRPLFKNVFEQGSEYYDMVLTRAEYERGSFSEYPQALVMQVFWAHAVHQFSRQMWGTAMSSFGGAIDSGMYAAVGGYKDGEAPHADMLRRVVSARQGVERVLPGAGNMVQIFLISETTPEDLRAGKLPIFSAMDKAMSEEERNEVMENLFADKNSFDIEKIQTEIRRLFEYCKKRVEQSLSLSDYQESFKRIAEYNGFEVSFSDETVNIDGIDDAKIQETIQLVA